MPLQTACSSCSAKIKVKDELIGKSIKCPKCGKVFKAAAEGAAARTAVQASAASKPAAKKPPAPAWDDDEEDEDEDEDAAPKKVKAKSKPSSDDDEDDDDADEEDGFLDLLNQTKLSDSTKKMIKSELGLREQGIWIGQPDPKIMTVRAIPKVFAGLFVMLILCIFVTAGGIMGADIKNVLVYVGLGIIYLVGAVALGILIPFMDRRKALATAYVITNKRCIVYSGRWFGGPSPESFYPDLLAHMRRMQSWIFGGGAGDIVFRSVTTITTTHHRRGGSSTSSSTTYYGFLGIRDMDDVERRIREALLTDDDDDDDDEPRRKKKKKR
jgi:predicted Zn finger-like uncharacterized protein